MRNLFNLLIFSFFLAVSLPAAAHAADAAAPVKLKEESLTIKTSAGKSLNFTAEIAQTREEQETGLQNRKTMEETHGMLFIFPENTYIEMWMKNTLLSLDMLFIDEHGKIVYIAKNAKPGSTDIISAKREARAVLELIGGAADKLAIAVGDTVAYPYFKP